MDAQPPFPIESPPPAPATSLPARLLNVFATPGEVFEEVKSSRATASNWLVPALLGAVLGLIAVWILFSQPAFIQHSREQWSRAYDGMVKSGKMSQGDADKAVAMIEKVALPAGMVGGVGMSFVRIFWWALVIWLLSLLFLKIKISYLKALEVAGLATMVGLLGDVVTLLLTMSLGKETSLSLAMAVTDFNPKNPLHLAFAAANIFSFWIITLMSLGLARLAGVPFSRAMFCVVAYWIMLQFVLISLGTLIGALVGGK